MSRANQADPLAGELAPLFSNGFPEGVTFFVEIFVEDFINERGNRPTLPGGNIPQCIKSAAADSHAEHCIFLHFSLPDQKAKRRAALSSWQPGYLGETRGFPSPPHDRFGFFKVKFS